MTNAGLSLAADYCAEDIGVRTLTQDKMMVLHPRGSCEITCRHGVLWITIEGDSRDFFLQQGQSLSCSANCVAIIEARSLTARFTTNRIESAMWAGVSSEKCSGTPADARLSL
jgi:Protein of unknown function (DUF2917)